VRQEDRLGVLSLAQLCRQLPNRFTFVGAFFRMNLAAKRDGV
jgi:hypothetical protein